MTPADPIKDLELLIRSRYGLIQVASDDEGRVVALLHHVADRLDIPYFSWSRLTGLQRAGQPGGVYGTEKLETALSHIYSSRTPALYHFHDLHGDFTDDRAQTERMKAATEALSKHSGAVVCSGTEGSLPTALERISADLQLPGPTPDEFRALVSQILRDLNERDPVRVNLSNEELTTLINHLSGLTLFEAEKILTKAIIEDGGLTAADIQHVVDAKRAVIEKEGLLEYYPVDLNVDQIADLTGFKSWLAKRTAVVTNPQKAEEYGLAFPRGVLLVGVPGCGKSLSAKAVAAEWKLPLLRLDPSNLYNKFIGESERNFKRAMTASERMAPVVLWIDEVEKAFATGGSEDGGVSQRILGTFLNWMQERRGDVFVVATANDIQRLPPEFLRKGRFDEIFYVDLPDGMTRIDILRIHIQSRGANPDEFNLEELAVATAGFSGSEIEQAIVSALYTAFADGNELNEALLMAEIGSTRPLSVTMAERVEDIRSWAKERAVPAN
ncbi:MAG: AAA family ATPase [Longimicrobiales bacterium]